MPGKLETVDDQPCRRCKETPPVLIVRKDPLCRDCFIRYVHTKVIKHMESFRVRNASPNHQRKLLLALSFGVSSITLLHVLDHLLKTQTNKTGRTGFTLEVVFVDTETFDDPSANHQDILTKAREAYPDYTFTTLPLSDIFMHLPPNDTLLSLIPTPSDPQGNPNPLTSEQKLARLLSTLPSATARSDVLTTLRTRLLSQHAQTHSCEALLLASSTTTLASKTLSETAKGRGFALPWHIQDGASPLSVVLNYPLRDLLKKELASYVELAGEGLSGLVAEEGKVQVNVSSKNTTIDDLMRQYFESVEEGFPGIVSNVVRTAGKLEALETAGEELRCRLCGMPVRDGRFGIGGWGGDQHASASPVVSPPLCYGCTRSVPHAGVVRGGGT